MAHKNDQKVTKTKQKALKCSKLEVLPEKSCTKKPENFIISFASSCT